MFDLNSPLRAARQIPLAEKSSSEFDLLLDYCYSCDAKLVTSQTAAQLLMLAEEYQVLKLKAECEEWLIEHVDPHTCVLTLSLSLTLTLTLPPTQAST